MTYTTAADSLVRFVAQSGHLSSSGWPETVACGPRCFSRLEHDCRIRRTCWTRSRPHLLHRQELPLPHCINRGFHCYTRYHQDSFYIFYAVQTESIDCLSSTRVGIRVGGGPQVHLGS